MHDKFDFEANQKRKEKAAIDDGEIAHDIHNSLRKNLAPSSKASEKDMVSYNKAAEKYGDGTIGASVAKHDRRHPERALIKDSSDND